MLLKGFLMLCAKKRCVNNVNQQDPTSTLKVHYSYGFGQRQNTFWTSRQFVTGTTVRNKQTILTHTYGLVRVTTKHNLMHVFGPGGNPHRLHGVGIKTTTFLLWVNGANHCIIHAQKRCSLILHFKAVAFYMNNVSITDLSADVKASLV